MSGHPERTPAVEPIPQELVDTFFDRGLDEGSREKFFGMLRADLSRCAEVAKTQRMISMLREPIEAPDMTDRIMSRVASRRGFLPERVRRLVTAGRLAAAACILVGVLGLAVFKRMAPDALRLTPASRPLSDVIDSGKADAASGVQHMAAAVVAIQVPSSVPASARPRGAIGPLTPGRTSVRTLARVDATPLTLPLGAGTEARFVFVDGVCIDRRTAATVAVGAGAASPAIEPCPEAIESFIAQMIKNLREHSSGPSAAGRNVIE